MKNFNFFSKKTKKRHFLRTIKKAFLKKTGKNRKKRWIFEKSVKKSQIFAYFCQFWRFLVEIVRFLLKKQHFGNLKTPKKCKKLHVYVA